MSNESKRQIQIDQRIGQVMGQFTTITQELRNALQRVMELEEDAKVMAITILKWIEYAREAMEKLSETYASDMQSALIEDIEKFCREKLGKKQDEA